MHNAILRLAILLFELRGLIDSFIGLGRQTQSVSLSYVTHIAVWAWPIFRLNCQVKE